MLINVQNRQSGKMSSKFFYNEKYCEWTLWDEILMTPTERTTHKPNYIQSQFKESALCFSPPCLAPPPEISTPLPPGWAPWDLANPFELVKLSENDTQFVEVTESQRKNNFFNWLLMNYNGIYKLIRRMAEIIV